MVDTSFILPVGKVSRQAQVLPADPVTGVAQATVDHTRPRKFECGGGCLASTASDYLRFAYMLLRKGAAGDVRILGRKTVEYMIADHATPDIDLTRLYDYPSLHDRGYGFGLGVAVRRGTGFGGTMARQVNFTGRDRRARPSG